MANCKYIKEQEIVSYNGGVDWQDVMPPQYRKGQLVEHDSEYCTEIDTIYRWRKLTGVYLCVDDMKYEKLILDESYDNGLSWYPAYPSQYTTGEAIGIDDEYCNDKFVGHYYMDNETHKCPSGYEWDGHRCSSTYIEPNNNHRRKDPIKIIKCDGNPELTSADTKYYSSYPSNYKFYLFSAEIGKCVTSIAASAFTNSSALTYVSMADSVASIGNSAFVRCGSLSGMNTTIPGVLNIPSGVTSIGNSAFYGCTSLSSVTIPNSVTSIDIGAFGSCSGLTSVTIGSSVTSIGNSAFRYCSGLTSVTIPSGVTVIGSAAFKDCSGLTSITCLATTPPSLGGSYYTSADTFDGSTCTIFVPCESLLLYINNARWKKYANRIQGLPPCEMPFKWKGTTSDGRIISAVCDSTSTISGLSGTGFVSIEIGQCVTTIGEMAFDSCSSLTSITMPNSITSIGSQAFDRCSSLTSIVIPSGVTSIGSWAFSDCTRLASITIEATTPPTLGSGVFDYTSSSLQIYVPGCSLDAYKSATNWRNYSSKIQPFPGSVLDRWVNDGYICVGNEKWQQMKEQRSCDSGATWTDTGVVSATSLIEEYSEDCRLSPTGDPNQYLTLVARGNGEIVFNVGTQTQYSQTYYYSKDNGETWSSGRTSDFTHATKIPVSNGDRVMLKGELTPQPVQDGVVIGIGNFSVSTIFEAEGNPMSLLFGDNFSGQTDLTNKPRAFATLFSSCSGLTSINKLVLPATILDVQCYLFMFFNCTSLMSIPNGLLPATTLAESCYSMMFYGCTSLVSARDVELPATTLAQQCYGNMFNGCTSLTESPVLSATTLTNNCYYQMFQGCTSLSKITCLATDISASNCTYNWVNGVPASGTFTKNSNMSSWPTGNNGIPSGWTVQNA